MAEQQAVQETEVARSVPRIVPTTFVDVAVYGWELVGETCLKILALCLGIHDKMEMGIKSVIITDQPIHQCIGGERQTSVAIYCRDVQAVAINVRSVWKRVMAMMAKGKWSPDGASFVAMWHMDLLLSLLHEIHHGVSMVDPDNAELIETDEACRASEEQEAEEWAKQMLTDLAKGFNIEPGRLEETPALNKFWTEFLEHLSKLDGSGEDDELMLDWATAQREMLESGDMWSQRVDGREEPFTAKSFRNFMHAWSGDEYDDESWAQPMSDSPPLADNNMVEKEQEIAPDPKEASPASASDEMLEDVEPQYASDDDYAAMEAAAEAMAMAEFTGYQPQQAPVQQPAPQYAAQQPPPVTNATPQGQQATDFTPFGGTTTYQQSSEGPTHRPLPRTGLSHEQTATIAKAVFGKMYNHIFGSCGRLLNSDQGFSNPERVSEIPIELTEEEKRVIVKCDCVDANGRYCPQMPTTQGLFGQVTKANKIPGYKVYINDDGVEKIRFCLAQNVNKRTNAGELSKPAQAARSGSCIMYIMDGRDNLPQGTKKFLFKIVDGQWLSC